MCHTLKFGLGIILLMLKRILKLGKAFFIPNKLGESCTHLLEHALSRIFAWSEGLVLAKHAHRLVLRYKYISLIGFVFAEYQLKKRAFSASVDADYSKLVTLIQRE